MKIEKVKRNSKGDITDVMINNNVYSIDEAIMMARDGAIEGVNVSSSKTGKEYLRSHPDETENNNLDNLPTF